jgi:hypothetical protein
MAAREAVLADLAVVPWRRPAAICGCSRAPAATRLRRDAATAASAGGLAGQPVVVALGADGRAPHARRGLGAAVERPALRRTRMMAAVARQGFELCGARTSGGGPRHEHRTSARTALTVHLRVAIDAAVVEQVQRLQGNDLTVLITAGGTGRNWWRAPRGSPRNAATFLP